MKCKNCNASQNCDCIIGCDCEQLESEDNGCLMSKNEIEKELNDIGKIISLN